ncbi:hypothetical protein KFE96_08240 [Kordiimonas sp. SCSIO 12603]|uniref:hypothetical protein n=1 Tax=Kordiimonas sp. SCSIO 12603 TaxID=2829596 RepID=UPI002102A32E|nr:hypothetical protein [Kordiimonas sp. SCSIO 12603]UTW60291.1 hypothetical protein KFE96_08240 [Kordiimonas sp. SCSIO 12603]
MNNLLKKIGVICGIAMCSTAAQATYGYIDVESDPGTYNPVTLGDDVNVSACGSSVNDVTYGGSYGLCTLSYLGEFSLTWQLSLNNTVVSTTTYSGSNAVNGLNHTIATGAGTAITVAGTYTLGLIIDIPDSYDWILLPNNYWYRAGSDSGIIINGVTYGNYSGYSSGSPNINGLRNTGVAFSELTINPATIPEPSAALLLLPAFAAIAARRRRKSSK